MKLLVIPSWYPNKNAKSGGIFFLKQAELFSQEHEVSILVAKENVKGYRKLVSNIDTLFKSKYSATDFFLDVLPDVKLYQFEFDNFAFFKEAYRIDRIVQVYLSYFEQEVISKWIPEVIHAHDVFYGGIVAAEINKKYKIPFVITSHTPINYDKWTLLQARQFKNVMMQAGTVTTVSDFDKRNLLNSIDSKVVPITIGNYIDERIFKHFAAEKKNNFLYVASTSVRKDFPTLIKAIRLVKQKSDVPFKLNLALIDVKDGITVDDIRELIIKNELEDVVSIHMNLSVDNGLLSLYQEAGLYVSSCYYETFGVAIAEAICCGIPVIAVDNGGVRDIIDHGVNGFIVPMKSAEIFSEYILRYMDGEMKFDPYVLRASIINKFGSEIFLNKLSNIYKSILND